MSKELAKTYDPKGIEERLYTKWMDNGYFHAKVNPDKKPFTIVMPPPNVTGQLHMGHALDETMQDILIRFKRMQGYEALWQPGTDHAAIATEVKVIDKLKKEGIDNIRRKEQELMWRFYNGVKDVPGVKIYGDYSQKERCAIVTLNIGDYDSSEVSDELLMEYNISTRSGGHCAPLMHKALGTVEQGAVRFSFSHYNTEEEVDAAVRAIHELAEEP